MIHLASCIDLELHDKTEIWKIKDNSSNIATCGTHRFNKVKVP